MICEIFGLGLSYTLWLNCTMLALYNGNIPIIDRCSLSSILICFRKSLFVNNLDQFLLESKHYKHQVIQGD